MLAETERSIDGRKSFVLVLGSAFRLHRLHASTYCFREATIRLPANGGDAPLVTRGRRAYGFHRRRNY